MRKESYLNLLILYAVLSVGNAVISNQNIEKSSDLHIRKKRVINHSPGGVQEAHVTMSRHIVQVLVADNFECAGNILQDNIILTASNCLYASDDMYTVLSGSLTKNRGTRHRVLESTKHPYYNIVLMKIYPAILLGPNGHNKIKLFEGRLPPQSSGLLSGWGCTNISPNGERIYPQRLMAALVSIISHEQCVAHILASHGHLPPANAICTFDSQRGACYGDEGGSLVYFNQLLGIYSYNEGVNLGVHPDVYVNLSDDNITRWINYYTDELQFFQHRH